MPVIYYDEFNEEYPALLLACGIGTRGNMVMIELNNELGWCSVDRIDGDF